MMQLPEPGCRMPQLLSLRVQAFVNSFVGAVQRAPVLLCFAGAGVHERQGAGVLRAVAFKI